MRGTVNYIGKKSSKKKWFINLSIITSSVIIAIVLIEIFLRLYPIPGVRYNISKYDNLVGYGYVPNSINIYTNDRGVYLKRRVNNYGYFDKDYEKDNPNKMFRIGFFGDSYTQAIQVPLQNTFHNLVQQKLADHNVETLSFGVSGFSTYQSYLNCKRWRKYFDLNMVVYVFCENDLGDQIKFIRRDNSVPYPVMKDSIVTADLSFRKYGVSKNSVIHKAIDFITSESLVFATLVERIKLLFKYGVKTELDDEERFQGKRQIINVANHEKNYPEFILTGKTSSWPDSLRNYAEQLTELVILNWKNETTADNCKFIILYTPVRGELSKITSEQDTWKPWLVDFCRKNKIPLIDPTSEIIHSQSLGHEIFYDHYTTFGHKAVAESFYSWYINNFSIDNN